MLRTLVLAGVFIMLSTVVGFTEPALESLDGSVMRVQKVAANLEVPPVENVVLALHSTDSSYHFTFSLGSTEFYGSRVNERLTEIHWRAKGKMLRKNNGNMPYLLLSHSSFQYGIHL